MATHPTKKKPGAKMGRPDGYTPEIGRKICDALLKHKSLLQACKSDKTLPNRDTIQMWRIDGKHKEFSDIYAQARAVVIENMAEEILVFSDERPKIKQHVSTTSKGSGDDAEVEVTELERVDGAAVQALRLSVDTRKWLLSKLIPRDYGDKVEHSGELTVNLADELKAARARAGVK